MSSRSALFSWCARVQQTDNDDQRPRRTREHWLRRPGETPAAMRVLDFILNLSKCV